MEESGHSASSPGRLTPQKDLPVTTVVLTAALDVWRREKSLAPAGNRNSDSRTRRSNLRVARVFVAPTFEQLKLFSSHTFALARRPNMPDLFPQVMTRNCQLVSFLLSSKLPRSLCFYIRV
jgi:hypothetical protein